MPAKIKPEGGFRTKAEQSASRNLAAAFSHSRDSVEIKLENFTKYVNRQRLTRLLALYEIFKRILPIKGSIIECGIYRGFGLMAWANLSAILEPVNLTRRIYGFDTFDGFPSVGEEDDNAVTKMASKDLSAACLNELSELINIYDSTRFLGHVNKVQIIKGDAAKTIPAFIKTNKHLVVSLLFLDFDLFEPTRAAIEYFYPRMPKGSIIAFDELDNPIWPGETLALLDTLGINSLRIERVEFDPYIGFAVID